MRKTGIVIALFVFACAFLVGYTTTSSRERQRHPLMRPSPETLERWSADYEQAPRAPLSPVVDAQLRAAAELKFSASVDLLTRIQYTPSQRDQGACGNCWVWAATGVLEMALYRSQSVQERLSIQFFDACYDADTGNCPCDAGTLSSFASWYNGKGYAVPWSNSGASYADSGGTCSGGCQMVSRYPTNYPFSSTVTAQTVTTKGVSQAEAIQNVKNVLTQGKGIWLSFYLPHDAAWNAFYDFWYDQAESDLWNPDTYCGLDYEDSGAGHAVLLVGYNDDDADENRHYWIVLNSWGTAGGTRPNGLFRMKMKMNYGCSMPPFGTARFFQTLDASFSAACSYSLGSSSHSVSSDAATGSVDVTCGSDCRWTASSNSAWITVTSGSSGMGNGSVAFQVAENTLPSSRTGTLTVAGSAHTVTQDASPAPPSKAGGGGGGGGGCFIATAAFGSALEPRVVTLREFREVYLLPSRSGRALAKLYSLLSPPLADVIARDEGLRTGARAVLAPAVAASEFLLGAGRGDAGLFGWLGAVAILLCGAGRGSRPCGRSSP